MFTYALYEHILYTNIDLKLRNKLLGPMYLRLTSVFNEHVFYTLLL